MTVIDEQRSRLSAALARAKLSGADVQPLLCPPNVSGEWHDPRARHRREALVIALVEAAEKAFGRSDHLPRWLSTPSKNSPGQTFGEWAGTDLINLESLVEVMRSLSAG